MSHAIWILPPSFWETTTKLRCITCLDGAPLSVLPLRTTVVLNICQQPPPPSNKPWTSFTLFKLRVVRPLPAPCFYPLLTPRFSKSSRASRPILKTVARAVQLLSSGSRPTVSSQLAHYCFPNWSLCSIVVAFVWRGHPSPRCLVQICSHIPLSFAPQAQLRHPMTVLYLPALCLHWLNPVAPLSPHLPVYQLYAEQIAYQSPRQRPVSTSAANSQIQLIFSSRVLTSRYQYVVQFHQVNYSSSASSKFQGNQPKLQQSNCLRGFERFVSSSSWSNRFHTTLGC